MVQAHDMSAPKMTRVTVRVPKTTLDQINDWVDALGVRRSHFLGIALVAGVRALMQASSLDVALASTRSTQPDAEPVAQEPVQDGGTLPDAVGLDTLIQMVQTLETEVARLKSEIVDLGEQVQAQRAPTRKRS